MMNTALNIITRVRERFGLSAPTTLIGVTDPDELQMLALLYEVCEKCRAARCFPQQKRKHTIATTASRSQYPLPRDFYSMILRTPFNTDEDLRMIGPVSDDDFADQLYGSAPSTLNFTYRIFGPDRATGTSAGQIELSPTPSSAVNLAFEYISQTTILPYTYIFPTDPQETVAADTDLVIFDGDLVKLGLKAAWAKEHGGDFQKDEAEFLSRLDRAAARMVGAKVGAFGGGSSVSTERYRVPYKSWSL